MPKLIQQYIDNETEEIVFSLFDTGQIVLPNGLTYNQGNGSPEGVVTAVVGSIYNCLDAADGFALYIKASNTDNTGWIGISSSPDVPKILYDINGSALQFQIVMVGIATLDTGTLAITIPAGIYNSQYTYGIVATSFTANPVSGSVSGNTAIVNGTDADSFNFMIYTARFSPL